MNRLRATRSIVVGLAASLVLTGAALPGIPAANGQQPAAGAPTAVRPQPTAEQLAQWVRDLNADEFLVRDTAMLNLLAAGPEVLPVLQPALGQQSLEATSRALHILQQLGFSSDASTQEQVFGMLEELSTRKEHPVLARRAEASLAELTDHRAARALAELEALGAKIERAQAFNGLAIPGLPLAHIEIGSEFRGDAADLERLKWIVDVPQLIFIGDKVTDDCVKHAAAMKNLVELHLYKAKVTGEGLAPLDGHPMLTQLGIYYTALGDAGLSRLKNFPSLNFVKLYGTDVKREGVDEFLKATGLLSVDYRRGAFLGVGCQSFDGACLISNVHGESPAEKAGLLRDDAIVRFGEAKIVDFETLTAQIAERDPGDSVEVEVERRTIDDEGNFALKHVTTTVTLAPWEVRLAVMNARR